MKEIWKDIPNYKGYYQVSNLGRVKSLKRIVKFRCGFRNVKERILKQGFDMRNYMQVYLSKHGIHQTIKVHQLVTIAFLNHKPCGHTIVVDHINNIKTDNRLENLQLITNRENCCKDKKEGSSEYIGVTWYKSRNKWKSQIRINGKQTHIGYFTDEYKAHLAYKDVLKKGISNGWLK